MKYTKQQIQDSTEYLNRHLSKGSLIVVVIHDVSKSGGSRNISLYTIKDNDFVYLTTAAATVLGWPLNKRDHIRVSGCGMNMCFHTVETLSRILTGESYSFTYKSI
jgi:hypothetical protein